MVEGVVGCVTIGEGGGILSITCSEKSSLIIPSPNGKIIVEFKLTSFRVTKEDTSSENFISQEMKNSFVSRWNNRQHFFTKGYPTYAHFEFYKQICLLRFYDCEQNKNNERYEWPYMPKEYHEEFQIGTGFVV